MVARIAGSSAAGRSALRARLRAAPDAG